MKISKFLIFKIDQQKFAIKTSSVINIVENAKLVHAGEESCSDYTSLSFRGMTLPLINMRELLGLSSSLIQINECVLVAEIKINNTLLIAGISIDEVLEVAEIDDFSAYPYIPFASSNKYDFREAIVVRNGEPVIIINANKINFKQIHENLHIGIKSLSYN
jgi:chemotaxis signal transduction protein